VTLDLNDHLLQSPDSLVTTLLWHLVAEVVASLLLGGVLDITGAVLVLIWNVLRSAVAELVNTRSNASSGIDARVAAVALILSSKLGRVAWVAGTAWMGGRGGVPGSLADILGAKWSVSVNGLLQLALNLTS
jgi:hypothetical protein